jgi:phosphoserine phosphatase RsbU/P
MMLQNAEPVKRILVVDRHTSDTNRLARELPKERFAITCADSPDEAIALVRKRDYDCALIEMDSADIEPLRLLRTIRRECPMVKVIMMTDYGDEEMWIDVLSEGAEDLVAKPVALRDIQARL